ncbi:Aste57867_8920 [Aphanomyces stellatus]|uniref:Aste57867_8920 protein n=1 Tax=Aphanomyces stellatus TaxID=120398 RepID=A0A485KLP7_9STRA|nr:hypothetical protein As57867_008885 [Aphanomyces stellatus]VFT85804.1 Aste57867_8920 [Aphanomyces stellatus]
MDSMGATARTPMPTAIELSYNHEHSYVQEHSYTEETLPILHHVATVPEAVASSGKYTNILVYGITNAVILVPLMISFAQIIFRDPVFQPYLSELVKLAMVSGAVHQMCFSLSSTMPFAVGQVQDAGLIFLSAMASSIVHSLHKSDDQFVMQEVLSTTLFTLCGSTAFLGVALVITGKLRWASFVQYLPMPVVGGYLSFIGLYCFQAGLSMMSSLEINNFMDWPKLASWKSVALCLPGAIGGVFLFVAMQRVKHFAALPSAMMFILAVFYTVMWLIGASFDDARAHGWIAPLPTDGQMNFLDMYKHFKPAHFHSEFLLDQVPTWIAMYFVVAFSSSLDVAAIEMALHKPLDHNAELQTVGWSNLVSGFTGGFTGSYIFSSTIFSMKSGVNSRLTGAVIFVVEIALVLSPVSIIAYVPKLFFGSLQTLFAVDLIMEWIVHARKSMFLGEYCILWFTFLVMNVWNLEAGIVLGIAGAGVNFILSYVHTTVVRPVARQSLVKRDFRERTLLMQHRKAIVVLELDGFIFFGSSVHIMQQVREHVVWESPCPSHDPINAQDVVTLRTRFLVMDFERVRGVDVTAVRSCFNATKQMLSEHNITFAFANLPRNVQGMLDLHNVLDGCHVFSNLESALEWCEDDLLRMSGATPLHDQMHLYLQKGATVDLLSIFLPPPSDMHDDVLTDALAKLYIESALHPAGTVIYKSGSEVDGVYLVGKGTVEVYDDDGGMEHNDSRRARIVRVSNGAWLGDVDMVLNRRHSFTAETKTPTFIFCLKQSSLKAMRRDHPQLAARFDKAILQSMALWIFESHVAIRV